MDLNRQTLAGEEIFDEQLARLAARIVEPDLADRRLAGRLIAEQRRKVMTAPRLFDAMMGKLDGRQR